MNTGRAGQKDAYSLILDAIDTGTYRPGDRLVESDLAERFGVSTAAVSKVITRLKRDGLVIARPYRGIFLTESGETLAKRVAIRHAIVLDTLRRLGVPEEIARADSEGIEHHCSEETVVAMRRFLDNSTT